MEKKRKPKMTYIIKIIVTTTTILVVSELAKRFTVASTVLASLPLVSILAIFWLYSDTKNVEPVIDFSSKMFWAVVPSLLFFFLLPRLLKHGTPFAAAMLFSGTATALVYIVYVFLIGKFGMK